MDTTEQIEEQIQGVWEYLENTPNRLGQRAQDLYVWGLNYDRANNPFLVFLDLIGWAEENYGERMLLDFPILGYVEMDLIGDALKEYATYPQAVDTWLKGLMNCEGV